MQACSLAPYSNKTRLGLQCPVWGMPQGSEDFLAKGPLRAVLAQFTFLSLRQEKLRGVKAEPIVVSSNFGRPSKTDITKQRAELQLDLP